MVAEAEDFVRRHHAEQNPGTSLESRLAEIRNQVADLGFYRHTAEELVFGARLAWRNSARCIGRLYWSSLRVCDLREVRDAAGVAAGCVNHLREAGNGGRIRPTITIFGPDEPGRPGPRIRNEQLIRYAGYRSSNGTVVGDPRNVELTETACAMGWRPLAPRGPFDVLPLIIDSGEAQPLLAELPSDAVLEVRIVHPELAAFADLGLRWHAVPVISNMRLRIGGIEYPAAPFNGWYMGTEIGARNLGDEDRYDLLPAVARLFGLDTSAEHHLWRDRALVEINRAVLHSFQAVDVTITDHHTESRRFLSHVHREERAGRACPTDWSWIVPPISGSATPVFHRYYDAFHVLPNFLSTVVRDGAGCPVTGTVKRKKDD